MEEEQLADEIEEGLEGGEIDSDEDSAFTDQLLIYTNQKEKSEKALVIISRLEEKVASLNKSIRQMTAFDYEF